MKEYIYYFFLGYFLFVNLYVFVLRAKDKKRAVKNKYRISEKKLLKFVIFGGFLGAWFGIKIFRHKNLKGKFLNKFFLYSFLWIIVLFFLLYYN